jgi:hypothetical protein
MGDGLAFQCVSNSYLLHIPLYLRLHHLLIASYSLPTLMYPAANSLDSTLIVRVEKEDSTRHRYRLYQSPSSSLLSQQSLVTVYKHSHLSG